MTVRGPKAGLAPQRTKVREAGFFDRRRQITFTDTGHELYCPLLEIGENGYNLSCDIPSIPIFRCVIIPYPTQVVVPCLRVPLRGSPGQPVWKVPGQKESNVIGPICPNRDRNGKRSSGRINPPRFTI